MDMENQPFVDLIKTKTGDVQVFHVPVPVYPMVIFRFGLFTNHPLLYPKPVPCTFGSVQKVFQRVFNGGLGKALKSLGALLVSPVDAHLLEAPQLNWQERIQQQR